MSAGNYYGAGSGVLNDGQAGVEMSLLGVWTPAYHGLKAWNGDPGQVQSTAAGLTSGETYAVRVPCPNGFTAANLWIDVRTAGITLTSGQNLIGLANAAGTLIGTCPDQTTPWATTGIKQAALTVVGGQSLVVAPNSYVYVCLISNGTTPVAPFCFTSSGVAVNANLTAAIARAARIATVQTALPSSFTPSAMNISASSISNWWVGVN